MTDSKLNTGETTAVLRALCAGYDPDTGRVLPEQYIPRSEAVLAALHHAASALEEVNKKSEQVTKPRNQGKRWTDEEEKSWRGNFDSKRHSFKSQDFSSGQSRVLDSDWSPWGCWKIFTCPTRHRSLAMRAKMSQQILHRGRNKLARINNSPRSSYKESLKSVEK